jgi:hypothetical protein
MLEPLPPGQHTLFFHAKQVSGGSVTFDLNVTYNIVVAS